MKFLYKRDWMDEEIVDAINHVLICWQNKWLLAVKEESMTDERRKKIEDFYKTMGQKRQQVSDGSLLDQCEQMMGELLGKREAPPEEKKEGEQKQEQGQNQ